MSIILYDYYVMWNKKYGENLFNCSLEKSISLTLFGYKPTNSLEFACSRGSINIIQQYVDDSLFKLPQCNWLLIRHYLFSIINYYWSLIGTICRRDPRKVLLEHIGWICILHSSANLSMKKWLLSHVCIFMNTPSYRYTLKGLFAADLLKILFPG